METMLLLSSPLSKRTCCRCLLDKTVVLFYFFFVQFFFSVFACSGIGDDDVRSLSCVLPSDRPIPFQLEINITYHFHIKCCALLFLFCVCRPLFSSCFHLRNLFFFSCLSLNAWLERYWMSVALPKGYSDLDSM